MEVVNGQVLGGTRICHLAAYSAKEGSPSIFSAMTTALTSFSGRILAVDTGRIGRRDNITVFDAAWIVAG